MKKFICIVSIFLSASVWAKTPVNQDQGTSDVAAYQKIKQSADELRSHEKEIRSYFMQIVLRKAQMDVVTILTRQKLSDQEIQKVVESDSMKHFLSGLEKNPKIRAMVKTQTQKLLEPGVIEAYVLKQRDMLAKEMQEETSLALNQLQSSQKILNKEEVFEPEDNRSLITKIWNHLIDDLYKN